MVTLADAGPFTQSVLLTGGKTNSGVGPGVGNCVITVQPEAGEIDSVGTINTAAGAGRALVGVTVGVA